MIGREKETAELNDLYNSNRAELIAVYGRRRVGKTYLINQVFKDRFTFRHTALSPEGEEGEILSLQLDAFCNSLNDFGLSIETKPTTWLEAFNLLKKLIESKGSANRQVVFFDEFPWLDTKNSHFIKAFEFFWNSFACNRENLMVIVCGSANSWLQNNLINNHGGLYGRVTYEIKLSAFSLKESEDYLISNNIHLSRYDIATSYMILGGIPYYLSYIKKGLSLAQNIDNLFFNKNAQLSLEFDRLFLSCFEHPEFAKKIVTFLNEKRIGFTREEIVTALKIGNGGNLTKVLNSLISSDFIIKYIPFGKTSNVSYYKLIDPFCLFYLRFVNNKTNLESFWQSNEQTQTISVWRGLSFENLCFNHIAQIKNSLKIGGVLTNISSWNYVDDNNHGQVDLIIDRKDNVLNLCEIKFYQDDFVVDNSYYRKILARNEAIKPYIKKKTAVFNTLITTFGIKPNEYSNIFQNIITLNDLFN